MILSNLPIKSTILKGRFDLHARIDSYLPQSEIQNRMIDCEMYVWRHITERHGEQNDFVDGMDYCKNRIYTRIFCPYIPLGFTKWQPKFGLVNVNIT